MFATLRDGDVLVHHPYESFATSVQRFIEQAAADPNVLAIKQTLYRTSGDSPIVDALIDAAEAGKQVVALVEIKARFDEQANIKWARALERAGCHVVYGVVGLKTHCKTALVVRQEGSHDPPLRAHRHRQLQPEDRAHVRGPRPVHRRRGDLRRPHRPVQRAHRLLAPDRVPLAAGRAARRARRADRAHRARDRARPGRPAARTSSSRRTTSSTSRRSTRSTARRAPGVRIDLLVRTFCTIRSGVPGLSENITTRSILGRFLEHSRVYYFGNDGEPEYWIGSADLMHRNLDRRVEVLCQVSDPGCTRRTCATISTSPSPRTPTAWDLQPGRRMDRAAGASSDYQELLMKRLADRGE